MKSFNNKLSNASYENLKTWNPPELGLEILDSTTVTQKGKVLAIFGTEIEDSNTQTRKGNQTAALHSAGTNENYAAWQPVAMNMQPAKVRMPEWTFIESSENPSNDSEESQMSKTDAAGPGRYKAENGSPMILERTRIQAEELILAAQAEADDLLLQAQSEIDEQKKEGYQQGNKESRLEIEDALKAAKTMVEEVCTWKTDLMAQGEQILVEMLKEISRKMFGDGVELDKNALQANLNRIMESAHGLGSLNIFLNPKDARILDSSWVDQQMLITGGQAKIIPSGNIMRGGCYVKGNMGTVDGRLETQLDAFLKTFDDASKLAE